MRPVASAFAFAVVLAAVALDYVVADDCMPEGWDPKVAIGDKAFLCLRFNNRTQAVFTPEVDQFTQLSITNSDGFMPENTGYFDMTDGRWVAAQSDNTHEYVITAHPVVHTVSAGFWKTYKKWKAGGSIETLPIVTAIIFVDNGDITSITYDEGCFFCDPLDDTVCVKDTFVPKSTGILNNDDYKGCVSSESDCNADSSSCDLNFYVVWSGTDKNGNFMRSAGMRFSRFRSFGVEGLYTAAKEAAIKEAETVAATASKVQAIGSDIIHGGGGSGSGSDSGSDGGSASGTGR